MARVGASLSNQQAVPDESNGAMEMVLTVPDDSNGAMETVQAVPDDSNGAAETTQVVHCYIVVSVGSVAI